MKNKITITISIPSDYEVIHSYSAILPYDGDEYDVKAGDVLREVLHLIRDIYGEIATDDVVDNIHKFYM